MQERVDDCGFMRVYWTLVDRQSNQSVVVVRLFNKESLPD